MTTRISRITLQWDLHGTALLALRNKLRRAKYKQGIHYTIEHSEDCDFTISMTEDDYSKLTKLWKEDLDKYKI
jgi:hypothetical protein